ncbi:MAG: response regulator, partial [Planctomycetaceae bacterium]
VVDDQQLVRDVAVQALTHEGYDVLTANSGEEAVLVYREHCDRIVTVIIDISMPGIDGVETLRQLKVINKNLKGILSSGGLTANFVLGSDLDFLVLRKPYRLQELVDVVHRAQEATKTR